MHKRNPRNDDTAIIQDVVRIAGDLFRIDVVEKRNKYIATIYFDEHVIISERGDSIEPLCRELLERLHDSLTTEMIQVRDTKYPSNVYEFEDMYYAHITGEDVDGFGFGVERGKAIDRAINEMNNALGPQTLDDIGISMERIDERKRLEVLRERMERGETIRWDEIDIQYTEGEIEEVKHYYGIQNDEALDWMDRAIDRLNE